MKYNLPEAKTTIDKNNLDTEAAEQPKLMRQWGRLYADAIAARKTAEDNLAECCARLRNDIRERPESFGVNGRITVESINDALILLDGYRVYLEKLREAEDVEETYKQYVRSLASRDGKISDLVKLHGQMYFQRSNVDSETRAAYQRGVSAQVNEDAARAAVED
jgi:hypothetical protein